MHYLSNRFLDVMVSKSEAVEEEEPTFLLSLRNTLCMNMKIRKAPIMCVLNPRISYTCVIAQDICLLGYKAPVE